MFTLPIKAGWYYMILAGMKKEIYREIKPYYSIRFKKLFHKESLSDKEFVKLLDGTLDENYTTEGILRNGYGENAPSSKITFSLTVKDGKAEWGAEPGKKYYTLMIKSLEEIC